MRKPTPAQRRYLVGYSDYWTVLQPIKLLATPARKQATLLSDDGGCLEERIGTVLERGTCFQVQWCSEQSVVFGTENGTYLLYVNDNRDCEDATGPILRYDGDDWNGVPKTCGVL